MSVRFDDGLIRIEGDGVVEDAEALLALLQMHDAPVDLSRCGRLHTAPFQILLALRPPITGFPSDAFARDRLVPMLSAALFELPTAG